MQEATHPTGTASPAETMSFIQRVINVFVNPGKAFIAVRNKPNWIPPAMLVILLGLLMTYLIAPIAMQEQEEKTITMLEKRGMSQDQIDEALESGQAIGKYIMYPSALIGGIVVLLLSAAIWLFVSNTLLGGQARYTQMLEVAGLSSLIATVGMFIKIPIILAQKTMNVHFSLATFLPENSKDTFLYKFLINTDLFNVWSIAVLCIGIAVVGGLKVKKVWPVVVALLIVWYLGVAALGNLFGR